MPSWTLDRCRASSQHKQQPGPPVSAGALGGATVASVGGGETLWFTVTLTEIQRVAALRLSSKVGGCDGCSAVTAGFGAEAFDDMANVECNDHQQIPLEETADTTLPQVLRSAHGAALASVVCRHRRTPRTRSSRGG